MHLTTVARSRAKYVHAAGRTYRKLGVRLFLLCACACLLGCQATNEPYLAAAGSKDANGKGGDTQLGLTQPGRPPAAKKTPSSVSLAGALTSKNPQAVRNVDYVTETSPSGGLAVLSPIVVGGQPEEFPAAVVVQDAVYDGSEVIVLEPYGVGADQPGLADNISARIGATYYSVDNTATPGGVAILESTKQIGSSDFFVHGGVATEYLDGEWPVSASVGISRLATIVDGQVVKPLILDGTYDLYWDSEFFGTDDAVYMDQVRMLAGYALSARLDAGVWAAIGLQSDSGWRPVPGGRMQVRSDFADRIAAYVSANVGSLGSQVLVSAGWEDNPGNYFMEANTFVPLTQHVNFWGGGGYSDAGSYDLAAGLEFSIGRKGRRAQAASADHCGDPCAAACSAPRYRGGWANDNYRGAQRVLNPSRARRMLADPRWHFVPDPVTGTDANGGVGANPPVTGGDINPPIINQPGDPIIVPDPNDLDPIDEDCLPRIEDRERREGNLSRFLQSLQDLSL